MTKTLKTTHLTSLFFESDNTDKKSVDPNTVQNFEEKVKEYLK